MYIPTDSTYIGVMYSLVVGGRGSFISGLFFDKYEDWN